MHLDEFSIEQFSDGVLTLVVNPINTMYVETEGVGLPATAGGDQCFSGLKKSIAQSGERTDVFEKQSPYDVGELYGGVRKAVSLGFYFPATRLVGVPERESRLLLENTGQHPYQLFASDQPFHIPDNK